MSGRISSSVFVGREDERARLLEGAAAVRSGEPRVMLVGGDAGIGKTRLVTEVTDRLDDTTVLVGGCLQLGGAASPLAPVTEIVRALTRDRDEDDLTALFGGPRAPLRTLLDAEVYDVETRHREQAGAARMHEAVLSLVETLATDRPTVVVLEDLHWATESTLDLVTFLAHNPPRGPALLVLTYRGDEMHRRHPLRPVLAELGRLAVVDRIDLPPLSEDEQRRQVAAIRGEDLAEDEVDGILARAEGNAFFAEELLAAGRGADLPATLRDILLARLATLPEGTTEVVRVAAAAGRSVDHRLLETVAGLGAHELVAGLRTAVEHGLLATDRTGYRFRHALLQEAAYDGLLPGERLRLHAAVADALRADRTLATEGGADAEIAHHATEAMQYAVAYTASLAAASRSQAVFAFDAGLDHLERALRLRESCSPDVVAAGPSRLELLRRAGEAADSAGDAQRGVGLLETALTEESDGASDEDLADVLNILAIAHTHTSRIEDGMAATARAIEIAPAHSTQRATALATQALHLAVPSGRAAEALAPARKALALARELGVAEQETIALFALGTTHGKLGDLDEAEHLLRESITVAVDHDMTLWATRGHINLGSFLANAGRLDDAAELERRWLAHCDEHGYAVEEVDFLRCNSVDRLVQAGRMAEATAELAKVRRRNSVFLTSHHIITALALHLCRAQFADARALLNESRAHLPKVREPQYLVPLAEARALLALAAGRHDEAWDHLAAVRGIHPDREYPEPIRPAGARVEADRVADLPVGHGERLRALERVGELHRELTTMLDDAEPGTVWSSHLAAALAQVAAERTRASGEPTPEAWAEAEKTVTAQGRAPEVAYLRIRHAEALLGAGDRDAATTLLGEVHTDCVERGLAWAAQQAEALAKRARIRLPGASDPGANPFGLTEREREVLALVAHGLTNPQIGQRLFISTKTASVHVSNILAKVGATNRHRAGAIAREHGLIGPPEPSARARGPRAR